MKYRFLIWPGLCLALAILAGCFGKAPINRYYLLDYVPNGPDADQKTFPITVRIKDFSIAEAYGRPEIVYRKSAHELRFYNFHQWAVKPEHLISDMIFKHIRVSKVFANTVKSIVDSRPDYVLTGQILTVEEYDNEETWYAHLAINFQLENSDTKELVWQHSYDVRKIVSQHEPVFVVRELSFLLENVMDKVVQEMRDFFDPQFTQTKVPSQKPQKISPLGPENTEAGDPEPAAPPSQEPKATAHE